MGVCNCNSCTIQNSQKSRITQGFLGRTVIFNFTCDCLQVMTDVVGNPEEERRAEFYHEPWSQEAVSRYFYCKVCEPIHHSKPVVSNPGPGELLAQLQCAYLTFKPSLKPLDHRSRGSYSTALDICSSWHADLWSRG